MICQWIGAGLVILGCGGFGFSIAAGFRKEENLLRQLLQVLRYMECELQYRMTSLPELCRSAARETGGELKHIFLSLAKELECQRAPDAGSCMNAALQPGLPRSLRRLLLQLGSSLGRFDLNGQLRGLQAVSSACREELRSLRRKKEDRMRSYQTLGLCAGAALVIIFL